MPPLARLAGALGTAAVMVLATAAPAAAHGADAPDATNYRTAITGVSPALPGVEVRAIEAGARLELTNTSERTVEVLGYSNEPYLDVRPDGVYQNTNSPATYLNATLNGGVVPPANADPTAPPAWQKISDTPRARWHDKRARWAQLQPPPAVVADPGRPHRIADWSVPLRMADDLSGVQIHGTLDWVPPPPASLWWVITVLLGALITLLGFARFAGPRLLGGLLAIGGLAALTYVTGRELDAGARTPGELASGVFASELWPVVAGLTALAAGIFAFRRRPSALFALALSGAGLALFGGVVNAAVFFRSVAPVPWSDSSARSVIAVVLAVGAGVCGGAALKMRSAARPAVPADEPVGVEA